MKKKVLLLLSFIFVSILSQGSVYNICRFGAKGDARTINTLAINNAIDECSRNGGGQVLIPKGVFITGTIHLKNNVRLFLEHGAVLQATTDLSEYKSYIPTRDMSKFDSGDGTQNSNNSKDHHWNRALILGVGLNNFSIEGDGIIDGVHLFDASGEENMRGPHTIIIAESRNFLMTGITVNNAANYAVMSYDISNCLFSNLQFNEGWDGIHIRGGKNIVIRNCKFYTGDDAIAGGYWENMTITDCYINSSCNGIRMIMPADGLTVSHCIFQGPGKYPHRTSGELKRTNMLTAIFLQPGGWGKATGNIDNVYIHDIEVDNMGSPLMFVLNEGNEAGSIIVEKLRASHINCAATAESLKGGTYESLVFRDISISYVGNPNSWASDARVEPAGETRPICCWGWYLCNVRNAVFENVNLKFEGQEGRPAFFIENTHKVVFDTVEYQLGTNKQNVICLNSEQPVILN